ncbi:hypothetical protein D3C75_242520 [compost metagenome]
MRRGDRLGAGQIAGFRCGRANHIACVGGLRHLGRYGVACNGGGAIFRGFKTLLDSAAKDGGLAAQRQQQRNLAGGGRLEVLHIHQLRGQQGRPWVVRIAGLPVTDPGFQHIRVVAVIEPDALQIQPALQDIFIGVDHQRVGLIRVHGGERLPGGIDIFLFIGPGKQRLLSDQGTQQGQGRTPLFRGNANLPETGLLVFIQRADVDIREDLFRPSGIVLRNLQLGGQQRLLAALAVA